MHSVDSRVELIGEVLHDLFRQHKVTRAEVERRMGRAKGYLYRGFHGFQGISLDNLLLALDSAGIPFSDFCERLYRESHRDQGGGMTVLPMIDVQKMVNEAVALADQQREARELARQSQIPASQPQQEASA